MDPIHLLNFKTDSTLCLIREATRRGFSVSYYNPTQIHLLEGVLYAKCQTIELGETNYQLGEIEIKELAEFDVILMRQDPPFDMNYITATYLLEKITNRTLIVNNPAQVRNLPEKLFVCDFKEFTPSTLISQDQEAVLEFFAKHKKIVLKPLYAFGGADVHLLNNAEQVLDSFNFLMQKYGTALVAQKYLPEIKLGDKRIILIDGKIAAAVNRIPPENAFRANLAVGGIPEKTEITAKEKIICDIIGKELSERGIIIAGLDVIGEYVTEINVTCPTTFVAANELYQLSPEKRIESLAWDAIINRL